MRNKLGSEFENEIAEEEQYENGEEEGITFFGR